MLLKFALHISPPDVVSSCALRGLFFIFSKSFRSFFGLQFLTGKTGYTVFLQTKFQNRSGCSLWYSGYQCPPRVTKKCIPKSILRSSLNLIFFQFSTRLLEDECVCGGGRQEVQGPVLSNCTVHKLEKVGESGGVVCGECSDYIAYYRHCRCSLRQWAGHTQPIQSYVKIPSAGNMAKVPQEVEWCLNGTVGLTQSILTK